MIPDSLDIEHPLMCLVGNHTQLILHLSDIFRNLPNADVLFPRDPQRKQLGNLLSVLCPHQHTIKICHVCSQALDQPRHCYARDPATRIQCLLCPHYDLA